MTTYAPQATGANLSTLVQTDDTQDEAIRSLEHGTSVPGVKPVGLIWSCADPSFIASNLGDSLIDPGGGLPSNVLYRWNGTAWYPWANGGAQLVDVEGSAQMQADLALGSHRIVGLAAGTADGHAANLGQTLTRDGTRPMTGALNLGGFKATNGATPTATGDLATKGYVDGAVDAAGAPVVIRHTANLAENTTNTIGLGVAADAVSLDVLNIRLGSGTLWRSINPRTVHKGTANPAQLVILNRTDSQTSPGTTYTLTMEIDGSDLLLTLPDFVGFSGAVTEVDLLIVVYPTTS